MTSPADLLRRRAVRRDRRSPACGSTSPSAAAAGAGRSREAARSSAAVTRACRSSAHSVLVERASVTYRVTGFSGALTTNFAGLAPPECDGLGACGATGRLVQSFTARGSCSFTGVRIVADTSDATRARGPAPRRHDAVGHVWPAGHSRDRRESSAQTGGLRLRGHAARSCWPAGLASKPHRGSDELMLSDTFDASAAGHPIRSGPRVRGPRRRTSSVPTAGRWPPATVTDGQLGDSHLSITFHSDGTFSGLGVRRPPQRCGGDGPRAGAQHRRHASRHLCCPGEPLTR